MYSVSVLVEWLTSYKIRVLQIAGSLSVIFSLGHLISARSVNEQYKSLSLFFIIISKAMSSTSPSSLASPSSAAKAVPAS